MLCCVLFIYCIDSLYRYFFIIYLLSSLAAFSVMFYYYYINCYWNIYKLIYEIECVLCNLYLLITYIVYDESIRNIYIVSIKTETLCVFVCIIRPKFSFCFYQNKIIISKNFFFVLFCVEKYLFFFSKYFIYPFLFGLYLTLCIVGKGIYLYNTFIIFIVLCLVVWILK